MRKKEIIFMIREERWDASIIPWSIRISGFMLYCS